MTKLLKKLPNSWWESIQQLSIRGTPDIIGHVNGYFVALELKTKSGKLSKLQRIKLIEINRNKGIAVKVSPDNWTCVYKYLLELSEEEDV